MFAVVFEVEPKRERYAEYLEIAARLRPALEGIDGFLANERFASRRRQGRLLSLSLWRDEKALIRWRTLGVHHAAQQQGRTAIFADYRLRVGEVVADSGLAPGETLAVQRLDETATGATALTITEALAAVDDLAAALALAGPGAAGLVDRETFASIAGPPKTLLLAAWRDGAAAGRWRPPSPPATALRHRTVRVIRDYGMAERREAPQYYPPVPGSGI